MTMSELKKILKRGGCFKIREGKNHEIWSSPITQKEFIVGRHAKQDVPKGTADNILKAAGLK